MRRLATAAGVALALSFGAARADPTFIGFVGIPLFASVEQVIMPNLIGEANAAAADAILEGVGLDLGGSTARCSAEILDVVIGQSIGPGVSVDIGTLVDVLVSNGVACRQSGSPGVKLRGLRMRGL